MKYALKLTVLVPAFLGAALLPIGCGEAEEETPAVEERVVAYTVRGEVVTLPDAMNDLMVKHEAIPEFRDGEGTLGMNVMTMPFPLADGVASDGLDVGDKVSITFEVRHNMDWSLKGYEATEWEELPADTQLNFTPIVTGVKRFDPATGEPIDGVADYVNADTDAGEAGNDESGGM